MHLPGLPWHQRSNWFKCKPWDFFPPVYIMETQKKLIGYATKPSFPLSACTMPCQLPNQRDLIEILFKLHI